MYNFFNILYNFEQDWLIRLLFSIFIVLMFWIFAPGISYFVVRVFDIKAKKTEIKENTFYKPIKIYIRMLGIYLGFMFFVEIFKETKTYIQYEKAIEYGKKVYFILTTLLITKTCVNSVSKKSSIYRTLEKRYPKLDNSMIILILKMFRVVIYFISFLIILKICDINLNGLIAGLGLGGVIVTIAAQDTAKNVFAGLMVFLDRPFAVGDWISVDNLEGTVEEITFRSTRIRAFDDSVINIPNSIIANASIINYSKMFQRRYRTNIVLDLNTPLTKVQEFSQTLQDKLVNIPNVTPDNMYVKFDEITDNGMQILIQVFVKLTDFKNFTDTKEMVNYTIMKLCEDMQISLAYNSQTIYLQK